MKIAKKNTDNGFFKQPNVNPIPFKHNSVKAIRLGYFNSFSKNSVNEEVENISQKTFKFKDIIFTSEFNSGNMKNCSQLKENEFSVLIASDCEGKYIVNKISIFKIWFYFGVISEKERNVKISIDNLNNFYYNYKTGYKICYNILEEKETPSDYQSKYTEGEEINWKRLETEYELNLDNETNFLSIKFNFDLPKNRYVLFSFCFPWSYDKNEAFLKYIKEKSENKNIYYHDEILTLSKEKRNIHLLTITSI